MRGNFYLDERQQKKRRLILKVKIYGGMAAFFVLLIGAAYLIVYSSFFQITRTDADCTQTNAEKTQICTNKEKLIADLKNFFAGQSKIAAFLGPDNILIWRQKKIGEFLKNRPKIAELTIKKNYSKQEIKIIVKEREKFGVWCLQAQTKRWWFDKNGIIFEEAPAVEGNLIYRVNDFSGQTLKIGELVLKEKLFFNLLKVFEVLEKSDLKIKSLRLEKLELQEIIADSPGNSLPKIYFSLRIDPKFVITALESLKNLGMEKIVYIDFRIENRVYYKLK